MHIDFMQLAPAYGDGDVLYRVICAVYADSRVAVSMPNPPPPASVMKSIVRAVYEESERRPAGRRAVVNGNRRRIFCVPIPPAVERVLEAYRERSNWVSDGESSTKTVVEICFLRPPRFAAVQGFMIPGPRRTHTKQPNAIP